MGRKSKSIFKEISSYDNKERESLSPEYIAREYMKFVKEYFGKNVNYFSKGKPNRSKAWIHFVRLSQLLRNWAGKKYKISPQIYFLMIYLNDGMGEFISPSILVLAWSYQYFFGKSSLDPTYMECNWEEPITYEENLETLKEYAQILNMSLKDTLKKIGPIFRGDFYILFMEKIRKQKVNRAS